MLIIPQFSYQSFLIGDYIRVTFLGPDRRGDVSVSIDTPRVVAVAR